MEKDNEKKEYDKKYNETHKERIKLYQKEYHHNYYKKHKAAIKALSRVQYLNKLEVKQKQKEQEKEQEKFKKKEDERARRFQSMSEHQKRLLQHDLDSKYDAGLPDGVVKMRVKERAKYPELFEVIYLQK